MKKEDLRIVFLGTPEFAVASLDRIHKEGFNIVGVVTATDKPAGRGHKMLQSAVKEYAVANNLPLLQPEKLRDPEFIARLRSLNANLFVVIAFRMLPREVWQMPELGTFNLHASLLPRYRGAAPINWAVINGDKETGVTTFMLQHEIDTGDVLRQERIAIGDDETVESVYDRLMNLGADVTVDTLNDILNGTLTPTPQDQFIAQREASAAPKIFKETCLIDWNKPAEQIRNLVRGLSPYPAAWTELEVTPGTITNMKVTRSRVVAHDGTLTPGKVTIDGNRMLVDATDARVELLEIQPAGKKRMDVSAYLRGLHIK